ncbi:MAG: Asp23/Gls24 family envelope stress response protein [Chloroflexi bacterium]|nr:Asp23/Gls24 family envelope stress response protein [Chloroflexota bacterium]
MSNLTPSLGKTTIAPEVLITTIKLTALSVTGVHSLTTAPVRLDNLFKKGADEGVVLDVENNTVYADLYVILENDVNVRNVGRQIQSKVSRAISELVGMEIGKINVHIEDIKYPQPSKE